MSFDSCPGRACERRARMRATVAMRAKSMIDAMKGTELPAAASGPLSQSADHRMCCPLQMLQEPSAACLPRKRSGGASNRIYLKYNRQSCIVADRHCKLPDQSQTKRGDSAEVGKGFTPKKQLAILTGPLRSNQRSVCTHSAQEIRRRGPACRQQACSGAAWRAPGTKGRKSMMSASSRA